jgi:hypothetical protein
MVVLKPPDESNTTPHAAVATVRRDVQRLIVRRDIRTAC